MKPTCCRAMDNRFDTSNDSFVVYVEVKNMDQCGSVVSASNN